MVLPPDLSPAQLERCRRITFGRESAFVSLGRTLDSERRDLFAVAYASMRIPDDFVDEVYLKANAAGMPVPASFVSAWLDAYFDAIGGGEGTTGRLADLPFIRATRSVITRLGVGERPWRALARCLRRDVERRPPVDWQEFETYCEGACVAPAVVFLSILEHGIGVDGPRGFASVAADVRTLAVFCYLVHLARDLEVDLAVDRQLSCVPLSLVGGGEGERAPSAAELLRARHRLLERALGLEEEVSARLEAYRRRGAAHAAQALELTLETYRASALALQAAAAGGVGRSEG